MNQWQVLRIASLLYTRESSRIVAESSESDSEEKPSGAPFTQNLRKYVTNETNAMNGSCAKRASHANCAKNENCERSANCAKSARNENHAGQSSCILTQPASVSVWQAEAWPY